MSGSREITVEDLRKFLHLPEARVRHGTLDMKSHDGRIVVRVIAYQGWVRIQAFELSGHENWPDRPEEN